jgi:sugar phosphate isomerase/epimerase
MTLSYSITLSSFTHIEANLSKILDKLTNCGFSAIEIIGEPDKLDLNEISETVNSYGITVTGITGMWGSLGKESQNRKLLTSDRALLKHCQQYIIKCIRMCDILNGNELNVCLFADNRLMNFDKNHRLISPAQKEHVLRRPVPILKKLSSFASDYGIRLLLEPLNRYSTPYCTTANDAIKVTNMVDRDNFRIMLDTFHMNIEEDSLEYAVSDSKNLLAHMHFADNNRKMPGYGHIDFQPIMRVLADIGYEEYISFEPIIQDIGYEPILSKSLAYIKAIDKIVRNENVSKKRLLYKN